MIPIGTVIAFAANGSPSNDGTWLECNGQSCARYAELVHVLGKSTVPDYRNRFLEGSATPNTILEAGLPNITASFVCYRGFGRDGHSTSGAFYTSGRAEMGGSLSNWYNENQLHFDASRCSLIYGRSWTVQPPAVTVRYFIKAA